jgi:hypothetical protein
MGLREGSGGAPRSSLLIVRTLMGVYGRAHPWGNAGHIVGRQLVRVEFGLGSSAASESLGTRLPGLGAEAVADAMSVGNRFSWSCA